MFYKVIAVARDWSILILAIPIVVLLAVLVYLLWQVTRALRSFTPRVRPALRTACNAVMRGAGSVESVRCKIEAPFVWVRTAPAQVSGFLRALQGEDSRRR